MKFEKAIYRWKDDYTKLIVDEQAINMQKMKVKATANEKQIKTIRSTYKKEIRESSKTITALKSEIENITK